jgi:hypothetical protein
MTLSWRTLEREIVEILRSHHYIIERSDESGDTLVTVPSYDYPFQLSLTTFAKDLAKRLEQSS